MTRNVSDVFDIMRRVLGRRNENDPEASDDIFLRYLNDFISITMSDDLRLFENFGTLSFTIDASVTDGVYTFNDVGASSNFVSLSQEALISLEDPVDNSVSWNKLEIYRDPGAFFMEWGINNSDILITGFPSEVLFYGNEFTFRTIPNDTYIVKIYGYKAIEEYSSSGDPELQFDKWLRYLAYGAALNYASDFRFPPESLALIEKGFAKERRLRLTNTHNEVKMTRPVPKF